MLDNKPVSHDLPIYLLHSSLAEYLGEDQMLAIVCQSNVALTTPDKYKDVLMSLAGEVGQRIKHRQHIICLEDLRQVRIQHKIHLL